MIGLNGKPICQRTVSFFGTLVYRGKTGFRDYARKAPARALLRQQREISEQQKISRRSVTGPRQSSGFSSIYVDVALLLRAFQPFSNLRGTSCRKRGNASL